MSIATKYVLFHFKEMRITDWKIFKSGSGQEVPVSSGYSKPLNEYFVIEATNQIQPGNYEIEVKFAANVSVKLTGFYKSTYKNRQGQTRWEILLVVIFNYNYYYYYLFAFSLISYNTINHRVATSNLG